MTAEKILRAERVEPGLAPALFGQNDAHLRAIEAELGVRVIARGNELFLQGDNVSVEQAVKVLRDLAQVVARGEALTPQAVRYALSLAREGGQASLTEVSSQVLQLNGRGKQIRPKTLGQKAYVEAVSQNGITFAIGPAGTGKTYLAMTMAVAALRNHEVERIVLTRPAVEAGEKLGFLPGDLQEKVDPYLRPLYDALYDLMGTETAQKHMERGSIEVAPLAYMRGRTLSNSFIILDEAQNTTSEQMKMFLTRLGFGSRAVITGDITQVDLPPGKSSGLREVPEILRGIEGIAIVYLTTKDVVRHPLVQKVIEAYARYEGQRQQVAAAGEAGGQEGSHKGGRGKAEEGLSG